MINNGSPKSKSEITVFIQDDADRETTELLKSRFQVNLTGKIPDPKNEDLYLRLNKEGLALISAGKVLYGDFQGLLPRIKPHNLNGELLVKASKIKGAKSALTAIDATAGLGEDGFLLAAAGFSVSLYERDPIIAALLRDGLRRAAALPELKPIVERMRLFEEDSLMALPALSAPPDVVLLDPMFPSRQKSGLIKKKFQLLQQLEQPCADEEALLNAAIACSPRKVVIKRPLNAAYLGGRKPDYAIKGKTIRYDCIMLPRN